MSRASCLSEQQAAHQHIHEQKAIEREFALPFLFGCRFKVSLLGKRELVHDCVEQDTKEFDSCCPDLPLLWSQFVDDIGTELLYRLA